MKTAKLNDLLINEFPELKNEFEDYTAWQDGIETGCFLTHEDLLLPLARKALGNGDEATLNRIGKYVEQLMSSQDEYAINVATIGILEGLKADGNTSIRDYLGPISLKEYDDLKL